MENSETLNFSPAPKSFEPFLVPEEPKNTEILPSTQSRFEPIESPQKRRLSPDNDLDTSYKRRRNSSIISFDTPRSKLKDILKTPLDLFSRRKSISSTVTSLNDSTSIDLNQSCSSLNFVSTPIRGNNTMIEVKDDKFDQFKSPSLFVTPKHKSLFKKGFRKSFMHDTKSSLKNIVENDPNCSIDDVDVSVCESVKHFGRQNDISFISTSSAMEVEDIQCFRPTSSRTVSVLTFFI